jgi:hypothetical protein
MARDLLNHALDIPVWDIIVQCGGLASVDPLNIKIQKTGADVSGFA